MHVYVALQTNVVWVSAICNPQLVHVYVALQTKVVCISADRWRYRVSGEMGTVFDQCGHMEVQGK